MTPLRKLLDLLTGWTGGRSVAFPATFALVLLCHAMAVVYYEPPLVLFGDDPLSGRDLDTHVTQVWRVTEAMDGWGKSWAYDPQMLAGQPEGTIFDADNKGWEVWTYALWKLGLPKGLAFNMFVLLAHVLLPLVLFVSARMFGVGRWGALAAVTLGAAVWFFDGFVHWAWWEGMVAWAMASYLCLLPLALFHSYLRDGRWWRIALLAPVMAAAHLVHPYVFFVLAVPMIALYISRFCALRPVQHAAIAGAAAITVAANAYWIIVAVQHWHYILDSGYLGASTASHLLTDYLGLVQDRSVSGGAGMRSGFRFVALGAAAVTFWSWRKERDPRLLSLGLGTIVLAVVTYLGGYLHVTQQVQPYRFAAPMIFMALIPAGHLVERIAASGALRDLPRAARLLGAVVILVAAPRLVRDVGYFIPDMVPQTAALEDEKPRVTDMIGFGNIGYPEHKEFRHGPIADDLVDVARWLERHNEGLGRVAVEDWTLGEFLAWRTKTPVLGGFRLKNLEHSAANFFRAYPIGDPPPGVLRRYLETYAVRYVIASVTYKRFYDAPALLRKRTEIGYHVIFESLLPVSYFQENGGEVEQSLNRLSVKGTDPGMDVVLRFHWHEKLVCEPGCAIVREPVVGNPVGFIRVPAGHPADFEIVNRY